MEVQWIQCFPQSNWCVLVIGIKYAYGACKDNLLFSWDFCFDFNYYDIGQTQQMCPYWLNSQGTSTLVKVKRYPYWYYSKRLPILVIHVFWIYAHIDNIQITCPYWSNSDEMPILVILQIIWSWFCKMLVSVNSVTMSILVIFQKTGNICQTQKYMHIYPLSSHYWAYSTHYRQFWTHETDFQCLVFPLL